MVIIKDFDVPSNCVNCQNEGLSEIVGCGLFDECGKHPDCPFIEVKADACITNGDMMETIFPKIEMWGESKDTLDYSLGGMIHRVMKNWWNAPYKRGNENG